MIAGGPDRAHARRHGRARGTGHAARIGESAEDQLLKNVRSSIAEYERAKIVLRTARGRRAKAERGLIVGNGWAPYGYLFDRDDTGRIVGLKPDPTTAPIVRRIFAEVARLDAIDREVGRLRARLQRITSERLDAQSGSEADRALKRLARDAEDCIGRLLAE